MLYIKPLKPSFIHVHDDDALIALKLGKPITSLPSKFYIFTFFHFQSYSISMTLTYYKYTGLDPGRIFYTKK